MRRPVTLVAIVTLTAGLNSAVPSPPADAGGATRYVSELDGHPPRALSDAAPGTGRGRGGNVGRGNGAADGVASPDGARIASARGNELWMRTIADGRETKLAA